MANRFALRSRMPAFIACLEWKIDAARSIAASTSHSFEGHTRLSSSHANLMLPTTSYRRESADVVLNDKYGFATNGSIRRNI